MIDQGTRFGRLSLLRMTGCKNENGNLMAEWQCDCGNIKLAPVTRVKNGYTKSCGCISKEAAAQKTHGMRYSPTYASWSSAKDRATNANSKDFHRYGAVRIGMADRWLTFENFLEDMGERPQGTSIDRIDPSKGYEPGNCRWATAKEQARNRSDLIRVRTPIGIMALVDYAKEIGISKGAAHLRLKRNKLEGCQRV